MFAMIRSISMNDNATVRASGHLSRSKATTRVTEHMRLELVHCMSRLARADPLSSAALAPFVEVEPWYRSTPSSP
jgi:hypothetical protein